MVLWETKKKKSSRWKAHFRRLPVNPTWHPRKSLAAPSLSLVEFFWDLTIIHPPPEAEEDMRAAALCLWPFRDGESSGLEEPITSQCQDVCGFVLQGCKGGFSFVVDF